MIQKFSMLDIVRLIGIKSMNDVNNGDDSLTECIHIPKDFVTQRLQCLCPITQITSRLSSVLLSSLYAVATSLCLRISKMPYSRNTSRLHKGEHTGIYELGKLLNPGPDSTAYIFIQFSHERHI